MVRSLATRNSNCPSCSIQHEAITHFQIETLNIYALENPHLQSVINYKPNRDGGRSENFGGQKYIWGISSAPMDAVGLNGSPKI